ncbi:hypothetical protein ACTXT7_016125 [Hymenolepis weldensis]
MSSEVMDQILLPLIIAKSRCWRMKKSILSYQAQLRSLSLKTTGSIMESRGVYDAAGE